jgi:hypothetical protein
VGVGSSCEPTHHHRADGYIPLVLIADVAADGIKMQGAVTGPRIHFGDGQARASGWTVPQSDDSFIVVEILQNGTLDDLRELLGVQGPPNGLEYLRTFDGIAASQLSRFGKRVPVNANGQLDSSDAIFHRLILWSDRDSDGRSDDGELQSFIYAGVESIDLRVKEDGSTVAGNRFRAFVDAIRVVDGQRRTMRIHAVDLSARP